MMKIKMQIGTAGEIFTALPAALVGDLLSHKLKRVAMHILIFTLKVYF